MSKSLQIRLMLLMDAPIGTVFNMPFNKRHQYKKGSVKQVFVTKLLHFSSQLLSLCCCVWHEIELFVASNWPQGCKYYSRQVPRYTSDKLCLIKISYAYRHVILCTQQIFTPRGQRTPNTSLTRWSIRLSSSSRYPRYYNYVLFTWELERI